MGCLAWSPPISRPPAPARGTTSSFTILAAAAIEFDSMPALNIAMHYSAYQYPPDCSIFAPILSAFDAAAPAKVVG